MKIKLILSCSNCSHLRLNEVAAEKYKCFKTGEAIKNPDGEIPGSCRLWDVRQLIDYMEKRGIVDEFTGDIFASQKHAQKIMNLETDGTPKRKRKGPKWRQGLLK